MIRIDGTIPQLFAARVAASGDATALRVFDPATGQVAGDTSWRAWREQVLDLAAALVAAGAGRNDACAILAGNTMPWPVADLAAIHAGLVSVGIYPTVAAVQLRALLLDADATVVIVDSPARLALVRAATEGWERPLLVIADVADGELRAAAPEALVREQGWSATLATGARARRDDPAVLETLAQRLAVQTADDVALLIYTSGSTGEPRGARITHRCAVASARSVRDTLGLTREDSSLSFLPYAHAGERLFGHYTRIACGMLATLVEHPADVWAANAAAAPTLFGAMPRFYGKVYEALRAERAGLAGEAARRWDETVALGRERSRLRQQGEALAAPREERWREGQAQMAPVLATLLGTRLRLATSGGAALPLEVAEYLDACGVTVLGAYGQTEHLCTSFNRPGHVRHDSVGQAMPGTTLRIAADGEVQVARSALTFAGYHKRERESREAFTDDGAWLRTGDLGTLDEDGFLRITGRIKELIALSNGKKVAPLPLEARLGDDALIAHAVVCGEGRPYLVALVTLRWPLVKRWQEAQGIAGDAAALARHPALRAVVAGVFERANGAVSRPEQVKRFTILPHDLSVEAGEVTPTHKVHRAVVTARYAAEIDALYEESA